MQPSSTPAALAFYATHSPFSDPGEHSSLLRDLPQDLPALAMVVQGLLVHPFLTDWYGVTLSPAQKKDLNLRSAREKLERIHSMDPRPLEQARPPAERLVGNCRDHALLLTSILRSQGRAARARAGFAAYLKTGEIQNDHWIVEVAEEGGWRQIDPQIDSLQREKFHLNFDPARLPEGQFFTGAQAWQMCRRSVREGRAKSGTFGHNRKQRGWSYLRLQLLLDAAALNKIELLPWDSWWDLAKKDEAYVTADERQWLDRLAQAALAVDEDFATFQAACDDPLFAAPLLSRLQLRAPGWSPEKVVEEASEASASMPGDESEGTETEAPEPQLRASDLEELSRLAVAMPLPTAVPGTNGRARPTGLYEWTDPNTIVLRGAQQHNLKHVNVTIPRNKLVVLTGVSGSGKSSLAFDTLYAEGQRRYVESLSSYVRRFLEQMDKPKVDYIGGLSPAISIEQKSVSKNPRSTVGTITEVMDYLRVLFSRAGTPHCPRCRRAVERATPQTVTDRLVRLPGGTRLTLLAPVVRGRKGDHAAALDSARQNGFTRVRIDGTLYELLEPKTLPRLLKSQPHQIDLVVDRLVAEDHNAEPGAWHDYTTRVIDSVETALHAAGGRLTIELALAGEETPRTLQFSEGNACPHCDIELPELTPALFSFNAPSGMCPECNGLGTRMEVDPDLIVEHPDLSILDGASRWWGNVRKKKGWRLTQFAQISQHFNVNMDLPWKDLPESFRKMMIFGSDEKYLFKWENQTGTWKGEGERQERGAVYEIQRLFRQTQSEYTRRWYMSFMSQKPCPACGGSRLCVEARHVTLGGKTFAEVLNMTIETAYDWAGHLTPNGEAGLLNSEQVEIVGEVLKEIKNRLRFMLDVGLHYLNLSRPAPTLSGGEGQRIRLASQLGCGLVGVLYILDEPSIGLHARDQRSLLDTLLHLRDMGNTVLVVEHDAETMRAADWLIDLGPGAGVLGGEIVAEGRPQDVAANPNSLTGQYLSGIKQVSVTNHGARRSPRGWLTLAGARLFNLKNVTARFPLGLVTCVTGVSGSGKSSLVAETLYPALARALMHAQTNPGPYDRLDGLDLLDKVIDITQDPIGRTPRSNPATYVGMFDLIRQVYAMTPEAKLRGYTSGRFSFNVKGGRCESCHGHGWKRVEMHFLPDVWVVCQECKGARYNRHTLEITYKGKNIADALNMDVQEALSFFSAHKEIARMLQTLHDVGLDYLKLGQSATTLSGGEAQRVKLAKELGRVATGDTIYILDEPTTGLHFADIQRLLDVLHQLADAGNSVIIIEHNMDVIKTADWIIDLGPEGGAAGGQIIAEGTPEQVAAVDHSYTGQFLRQVLGVPI